jgi:hypothetical protein
VVLTDIAFTPHERDTLLTTDSVFVELSLRSFLQMRPVFKQLNIAHAYFTPVRQDSIDNFSFLYRRGNELRVDTATGGKGTNYGQLLNRLIETAFKNVPEQVSFRNLNVAYEDEERDITIHMPFLTVEEGMISTRLTVQTDSLLNRLRVIGQVKPRENSISGSLFAEDRRGIHLPFVEQKFGG